MTHKPKLLFVLLDGLGDVSIPEFKNKTPLEQAPTPFFDKLASTGITGIHDPFSPGIACGSDTAHFNMFGYPPREFYRSRGAMECLGSGLVMRPGDIGFKSNFATMDSDGKTVKCRRADPNFTIEGSELCATLIDGLKLPEFPEVEIFCKYATEHRCGIVISSPKPLSDSITGTDPIKDGKQLLLSRPLPGFEDDEDAIYTAAVTNALSDAIRDVLLPHRINIEREQQGKPLADVVLLRAPGKRDDVPSYKERNDLDISMVTGTAVIRGLGLSLGMNVLTDVPGAMGDYHSNFVRKVHFAMNHLIKTDDDVMFCHLKATDEASHDNNPHLKSHLISMADAAVRNAVDQYKYDNLYIIVTGDHTTSCFMKEHSSNPVPFLLNGPGILGDEVREFSEKTAGRGRLGRFLGSDITYIVQKALWDPSILNE